MKENHWHSFVASVLMMLVFLLVAGIAWCFGQTHYATVSVWLSIIVLLAGALGTIISCTIR